MLELVCFQSQNLEPMGAYEVEILHVASLSPLLCVCHISSMLNNFQGKKASEEKSAQAKKFT